MKKILFYALLTLTTSSAAPPNIVFILADDLGYGDLGCYGATKVNTPNIDRLASEGRRFTDAHSASAVCTPSRYALLTGEYPFRKDLWGPVMNPSPLVIDVKQPTLASMLKERGYSTACFGKWHLGFGLTQKPDWNGELKPGPLEVGFDHFFGIPVVNSHPPFVWMENHRVVGLDPVDPLKYGGVPPTQKFAEKMMSPAISGGKSAHDLYRDEELGSTLTEKSMTWMRAQNQKPFFLYFATPHIHHPFTPAAKFKGSSQAASYGDFIQELDWMVGEVLRTIDEMNQRDNTLVILTSDNGGMLNQGGQDAWKSGHQLNGNLLGFKFDSWEGGHRVPFIARWPGKIEPGSVSNELICQIDMLATFAALSGAKTTAPDSLNVLSALLEVPGKSMRDHLVIAPVNKRNLAIREGHWLYIGAQDGGGFTGSNVGDHMLGGAAAHKFTKQINSDIVDGQFKRDAPSEQLYNLSTDLSQSQNLADRHPDIVARLKKRLATIQSQPRSVATP
jgi:arylsulfatase A-like enzyme